MSLPEIDKRRQIQPGLNNTFVMNRGPAAHGPNSATHQQQVDVPIAGVLSTDPGQIGSIGTDGNILIDGCKIDLKGANFKKDLTIYDTSAVGAQTVINSGVVTNTCSSVKRATVSWSTDLRETGEDQSLNLVLLYFIRVNGTTAYVWHQKQRIPRNQNKGTSVGQGDGEFITSFTAANIPLFPGANTVEVVAQVVNLGTGGNPGCLAPQNDMSITYINL